MTTAQREQAILWIKMKLEVQRKGPCNLGKTSGVIMWIQISKMSVDG